MLSFHWRIGSSIRASKRRFCSLLLTSSQYLTSWMPLFDDVPLELRANLEEALMLLLGAEAHDMFHAGPVVPTAVEDHDLACRRKVREIALDIHLRLFAVRWSRAAQRPGTCAGLTRSVMRPDGAAFAGRIAALEHDDDPLAGRLHPILKKAQLGLEFAQLLLVGFARDLWLFIVLTGNERGRRA